MKKIALISCLIVCTVFLVNCKSGIDQSKAQKIIIETYGFPVVVQAVLTNSKVDLETSNWRRLCPGESILEENGFRDIAVINEYEEDNIVGWPHQVVNFKSSEKLTPYIVRTETYSNYSVSFVKTGEIQLASLNNLRKISESEYEAEFSIIRTENEIGNLIAKGNESSFAPLIRIKGQKKPEYTSSNYKIPVGKPAVFKQKIFKYDKGWQMSTDDATSLKEKIGTILY